jgi:hypothetical protein
MAKTVKIRIPFLRAAIRAVSAVVVLLTSAACTASCGEYVYSRHRTATHPLPEVSQHIAATDHDNLKFGRVVSSEENGVSHEIPVPMPCNGPECRQSQIPSLPIGPPTTVETGHQDRLICGPFSVDLRAEVSRRRDLHSNARRLRGFPLLIEMPPESVG